MRYCPACRSEFEDTVERCPACDEALLGSREEIERIGKALVYMGRNRADAEFALEVLKTHDIPASIDRENIFGQGPTAIFVTEEFADKAGVLLEQLMENEEDEPAQTVLPSCGRSCKAELIILARFNSAIEADPVKGALEANGIPVFLENEHTSRAMPFGATLIPVLLKVPASYARETARVLKEFNMVVPDHYGMKEYSDRATKILPDYFLLKLILFPLYMVYWLLTLPRRIIDGDTDKTRENK